MYYFFTIIPIGIALKFHSFLQFLQTIVRGNSYGIYHGVQHARGQAMKESVESIGANLAGGQAGVAVELASKVLNNRSMIIFFVNTKLFTEEHAPRFLIIVRTPKSEFLMDKALFEGTMNDFFDRMEKAEGKKWTHAAT